MEKSEIVVSLDIGTTKIVALVCRKNEFGKLEILGIGKSESTGVKRGMVANISQTAESIRTAIDQAQAASGIDVRLVNVGIAGQHIKSLQNRGIYTRSDTEDEINQIDVDALIDDMYKLVMLPGEQILHVLPQEYIVDGEQGIKNPIGMSGIRLEANFHTITGQVGAVKNIFKCVEKAGFDVAKLVLEPLASAEAVLSREEKEAGVALVDIGGGTTDIAIFHDDIIRHTAVIPFGGNMITEDIKHGCFIIAKQAEELKIRFGTALASEAQENECVSIPGLKGREPKEISVKNLAHIIQARMQEIIELVDYEIKNSGYRDKLIAGIVVTGGGAQLKHISQLFEFVTGISTRVGYPNEHLSTDVTDEIMSPMYSTGVGLVIIGFENFEKQKNKVKKITTHSKKNKGGFFVSLLEGAQKFFEETDEEQKK